ncbi:MAG: hypothetical protein ACI8QS_002605 [Planctomycetota bacterium]
MSRNVLLLLLIALPVGVALALGVTPHDVVEAAAPFSKRAGAEIEDQSRLAAVDHGGARSALPGGTLGVAFGPRVSPSTAEPVIATPAVIRVLVRDLVDDDVRLNASRAMYELERLGDVAAPYLREVLGSHDRQQRQLAAVLLYDLDNDPSQGLLAAAIEGLEHDRLPFDLDAHKPGRNGRGMWVKNAQRSSEFLHKHAQKARPLLRQKLRSRDRQQSFLVACLLAWGSSQPAQELGGDMDTIIGILAWRMRDNHVGGDAVIAASAMASLGPGALPLLRTELGRSDTQAYAFLRLLIQQAEDPSTDLGVLLHRMQQHGVSRYVSSNGRFLLSNMVGQTPKFNDLTAGIISAPQH